MIYKLLPRKKKNLQVTVRVVPSPDPAPPKTRHQIKPDTSPALSRRSGRGFLQNLIQITLMVSVEKSEDLVQEAATEIKKTKKKFGF